MGTNLKNTQTSVVPEDEKLAIIQEAKAQTLAEIVKRAKTIAQLDEINVYGETDKIEISNQKSIKLVNIVEQIKKELQASLGSIYTYCGSVQKYSELPADAEVGDVYDVKEAYNGVPAGTNWAWNGTDWDSLSGVLNLDGYATIELLENYVQKVEGKELIATEKIESIDELVKEMLSCVKYVDLGNGRKCIVLNNNDLIVGTSLDGSTYNLIMLSKFDIINVGTTSKKLNLNTPKGERVTVQEAGQTGEQAHKIAYLSDIPNFINKFVDGNKLFALTTASTSDEIKAALTYTALNTTVDSKDLDECIQYGKSIRDILYQPISVYWTGNAYLLSEVSMITPKSDVYVSNVVIAISEDGTYSCVKNGERQKLVKEAVVNDILSKFDIVNQRLTLLETINGNKIVDSKTGEKYDTIDAAIKANVEQISLFQNVTENVTLPSGKSLEIFGNGNTLTGYVKAEVGKSGGESNLKIHNLKLIANSNLHGINSQDQESLNPSKLNFELYDVEFNGFTEKGIYVTNPGNVILKAVKFVNCAGGSDYVVDFNTCAVKDVNITMNKLSFVGNEPTNSLIKVTQRGGEDDYAHDIKTGLHVWNSKTNSYDDQEGSPAKINKLIINEIDKSGIIGEEMIADVVIGSSPNTDGPAVGPRTSNGDFSYEINNNGKSKILLRYISETEFVTR